ncbi:MAG: ferrous iron transport protein A [Oscillospiraceae bacterium]|nr:ferrous iron transport protein A [Oscillospiraceae bacterium]
MNNISALSSLSEGSTAVVTEMNSTGDMRRRLMDMGLIEGTRVICLHRSPAGDPIAYLIRGAVIALRKEDTGNIMVRTDQLAE